MKRLEGGILLNLVSHSQLIKRFLSVFVCSTSVAYLLLPIHSQAYCVLASLPIGLGFTVLSLKLYDRVTADAAADLIYKSGGRAKVGYSWEMALARQGEREAACQALKERFEAEGDHEALRTMLHIALKSPQLDRWLALACQGLLKKPDLHQDDRATFSQILSTLKGEPAPGPG